MTLPGGYVGRFLNVDLSQGELSDEVPDEALLRDFVGGYGLGARVLYERIKPGADPLGPGQRVGIRHRSPDRDRRPDVLALLRRRQVPTYRGLGRCQFRR